MFVKLIYTLIFGIPKFWWAISSTVSTLDTGRPDPAVAGMLPKDPYSLSKLTANLIHALIPPYVFFAAPPNKIWNMLNRAVKYIITMAVEPEPGNTSAVMTRRFPLMDAWDSTFAEKIYPALAEHEVVAVHAPTGIGKSQFLSTLLMAVYRQVIYIETRKATASLMLGFRWVQRGTTWPTRSGRFTVTARHLLTRMMHSKVLLSSDSVFIMDEYDEAEPSQIQVCRLLQRENMKLILTSATRNERILELFKCSESNTISVPVDTEFSVEERECHPLKNIIYEVTTALALTEGRILILEPSKNRCIKIRDQLLSMDLNVQIFARGSSLPNSKIIVATQVIEKGVTIPGVSYMIDTGRMIRNHKGVLCHVNINESTKTQRKGRLGSQ